LADARDRDKAIARLKRSKHMWDYVLWQGIIAGGAVTSVAFGVASYQTTEEDKQTYIWVGIGSAAATAGLVVALVHSNNREVGASAGPMAGLKYSGSW
jgi:ABC-type enterobactin transport system permease subunit